MLPKAGAKVDKVPVALDPTQAAEFFRSYLTKNRDVHALFTAGPEPATPALQVLDDLGRSGDVLLASYDLTEQLVQAIQAGNLLSTIDQQQYLQGWEPVHWLKHHIEHGFVLAPGVDMLTGPALVDKSNAAKVAAGVKEGFR